MVVSERGAQASWGEKSGQGSLRGSAMLAAMGLLLAGCSTMSSMNPISWWHRTEGGKIAEERPPPPGADQPYPNIATIPAKPTPPDADALKKLTASLVADRTNAQHAAQAEPLADPSSPSASPALFGVGTAPPPASAASSGSGSSGSGGSPAASASMPAVSAPPAPPSAAPRKTVQSAPLAEPSSATAAAPVTTEAQPDLPSGPPSRPAAAGAPPPPPPPMPAPMPTASVGPSATIVFVEKASDLSAPAADEVKAFAAQRGKGTISVIGYGDSASSDPDAQSAALTLGLSRAQSIVDALKQDGVPGNAIRVSAEASGRGAALHLIP